jgi:hypothetical protein
MKRGDGDVVLLERTLIEIGRRLDFSPEVDLASAVAARLRAEPTRQPRPTRRWQGVTEPGSRCRLDWRRVAVLALTLVTVFATVIEASPRARRAVAAWLGLGGIRIAVTPSPPEAPLRPLGGGLDLGLRVGIVEARRVVPFSVEFPAVLGRPDEVYVRFLPHVGNEIFLVYGVRPGLPQTTATGLGLLMSMTRAQIDREFVRKISLVSNVQFLRVNGRPGFWIEGTHAVAYVDSMGRVVQDSLRLAGNVLIWQDRGITLRMESALSLADALRLAESMPSLPSVSE